VTGSTAELLREADRVADRVQVVAPRMAARSTADGARVLADLREACARLAALALDAEGVAWRPLPELAPHAVADQVLVLAHDLARSGDGAAIGAGLALLLDLKRRI